MTPPKLPQLRMMIGIPGSGKSTLAQRWLDGGEVDQVVSSDAIREFLTGDSGNQDCNPWPAFYKQLEDSLRQGKKVVADATHLTPKTWKPIRKLGEKYGIPPQAHIMRTSLTLCANRNQNRDRIVNSDAMYRMSMNYSEWAKVKVLAQHGFRLIFEHYEEAK